MDATQIFSEFTKIFRDVLDNDDITLARETTAKDIEEWDSLSHVQLIVAIEKKFKTRFNTSEINSWKNVGEMADAVEKRLK